MTVRYAAYGSNLHPLRLGGRVGMARLLGTGAIDDFALRFHKRGNLDGSGKCNIVEQRGSQVYVAIYEIEPDAVAVLDEAEGLGNGYEKMEIRSEDFGRCTLYRAQDSHVDDALLPFTWYKALVLAGCEYHDFPEEYVASVMSVGDVVDSDTERHMHHMKMVERFRSIRFSETRT